MLSESQNFPNLKCNSKIGASSPSNIYLF